MKRNKQTDKLNIKAILESGEVEKYSAEYFKLYGKLGKEKYLKSSTPEQRSSLAKKAWKTKRRLSTEKK